MTSPRKIKTNRANAQASTGPRTAPGRARAARNARRHGLSLSVFADPTPSEQVEALAREIAVKPNNGDIYQLARRVAEAQIDLQRVRYARHQFLCDRLSDRYYESRASTRGKLSLDSRPSTAARAGNPRGGASEVSERDAARPAQVATILLQETKQLRAMDRYERRALSRRKFAIRALDLARRQSITER